MKKVGFIGWRGMVGSVLLHRMQEEKNFHEFYSIFFSTSQIGEKSPKINNKIKQTLLQNAWEIEALNDLDIIVTCQGSIYTNIIYPKLRKIGWKGYWIDSASLLRMQKETIIVLDPINQQEIETSINNGIKTFVGGNCTVSLMLMSLGGLFAHNLIEWISISTYQAASGYGSKAIRELLMQMGHIYNTISKSLTNPNITILEIESIITALYKSKKLPCDCFKTPLAGNIIPWIGNNIHIKEHTQEEWKGQAETNKILNTSDNPISIDSQCVRVGTLRCHSQSFTIKLKKEININTIKEIIQSHNKWVKVISNTLETSLKELTPMATSGTLRIPIGRIKKMNIGKKYLSAFSVGDQLLWGAAEPLRRILLQLIKT